MTEFVQNDALPVRGIPRLIAAVFLVLVSSFTALSQDPDDVVRIDTELVSFEVTVTDKQGNFVQNLKREDFRLFEEGTERPVEFFQPLRKSGERRPLSLVFALDVSGSMTEHEIERLRSA